MIVKASRFFPLMTFFLFQCKTVKNQQKQEPLPFELSSQFFNGTFKLAEDSSYVFEKELYTQIISSPFGMMKIQGRFVAKDDSHTLTLDAETVFCKKNGKTSISAKEFESILESEKTKILTKYQAKNTQNDGFESMLDQYKQAKDQNEKNIAQEIMSLEVTKQNVNAIQTFLNFIVELQKDIETKKKSIADLQVQIDKKQKEIDEIFQQKIEESFRIEELNTQELQKKKDRDSLQGQMIGLGETIKSYQKKIDFLHSQYAYTEADLEKAKSTQKSIEDSQGEKQVRQKELSETEQVLLSKIKENNEIIDKIKKFPTKLDDPEMFKFKITEIQLWLDPKDITALSPVYERESHMVYSSSFLATCEDGAILMIQNSLK